MATEPRDINPLPENNGNYTGNYVVTYPGNRYSAIPAKGKKIEKRVPR